MLTERETIRIVMQTIERGTIERAVLGNIIHWGGWTIADRVTHFRVYNQTDSQLYRDVPQHSDLGNIIAEVLR